jgi:hypothetical protein
MIPGVVIDPMPAYPAARKWEAVMSFPFLVCFLLVFRPEKLHALIIATLALACFDVSRQIFADKICHS